MKSSAIVTGGTGGLGAAVVGRLLDDGWRVVVPWIVGERARARRATRGTRADRGRPVRSRAGRAGGIGSGRRQGAPLRGLVNLVGGFAVGGRIHETPLEEFERQFRTNVRATYLMTQAVLPPMLDSGGGSIVYVGTRAVLQPFRGAVGYIASKAAVISFAEAVAVEYRDDGVRSNAILPSVIDTPANRAAMPNADHDRWVRPQQIAGVIAFLLSDESEPVSGAAIPVYGRA